MKKWQKYTYAPLVSAIVVAMSGVVFLHSVSAAGGQIYLTPASPSVQNGSNLALDLRINPGQAVNNVEATVNYDSSKLTFVSVDTSSSAFSNQFAQTTSTGKVTLQRGTDSVSGVTVSSDARVAIINFKAATGSGSSQVTLSGADSYDSNGNVITMALGNATVSFTAPPSGGGTGTGGGSGSGTGSGTGTSGGSGTSTGGTSGGSGSSKGGTGSSGSSSGSTSGTSSPGGTPSPANTGTPPTVTDQNVQFTQAIITTTTPKPTQVYIRYGIDKSLNQQTPTSDFSTSHQISLNAVGLVPGQTYYYVVVTKDQSGAISQSEVRNFATKGLTVSVRVYDKNQKPLANKTVTLHSTPTTAKTDAKGLATFSNVTPGTHHIVYTDGNKSYDQQLSVINNVKTVGSSQTAPIQNVAVVYGLTQSNGAAAVVVVLVLLVLVAGGGAGYFMLRNKQRFAFADTTSLNNQPVVVSDIKHSDSVTTETTATPIIPTPASTTPVSTTINVRDASDPLSTIPDADKPQPGSTIVPKDDAGKVL